MASEFGFSSSSSSSSLGWKYDVFLSFRGEDTRKNFTDHLHTALVQAGIHTFRDDEELPRGEEISLQLLKAIQESRICIVVFSKGYASSTWCLDELQKIMECKNNNTDQIVLPVFYNIDPSNVRKQKRSFAEAFEMHEKCFKEEMEKVNKWRKALKEAANLSGFDLNNMANGHESKCIQKIVEDVRMKLDHKPLYVAKHPVGTKVDEIISLLSISENDIRVLGIYGMPGIGKTTIAKALFNRLCYGFEGCCFLFNVKEKSKQDNGLVQLQKQLLRDILKSNCFEFRDECRGVNLIKERLSRKRILLLVDDVDQFKQLQDLVGERSWFGRGSRIIITTRDERLLTQFEVDEKFMVKELNQNESLELFSWHAFRDTHPLEDCLELSYGVVKYCGGLPLALEVLGSSLFKRSKHEWESTIKKLQKIPNNQIQEKLQISFDTLDDDTLKDAFLDIACFFIGWNKEYVAEILEGRGFYADICIAVLLERSLVKINKCNQFDMHDLMQDMGREIVRKMSLDNPGKRSRIWFHEDALDVLNKHMGTAVVKGLKLDVRSSEAEAVCVSTKSFTKMRHLQLLQMNGVHLSGSYEYFSKELIWLCWLECPLTCIPSNLELENIVILDIQHSDLKELWPETKNLNKLKILNLSHSKYLRITPHFWGFSNLERLVLEDCPSLSEVHRSIECLGRLVFLNLKGCCRLKILPESMGNLKSLETLNIAECSNLEKLPENLGDMESLTELIAEGTAIRQLPSSTGQLKKLRKLSLGGRNWDQNLPSTSWFSVISSWFLSSSNSKALLPASFFELNSLSELNLGYCGLSDGMISKTDFGRLSSLEFLCLSGNKFFNLPSGIGCLPRLQTLRVTGCINLVSISELPSSLTYVIADDCTSMESVSIPSKAGLSVDLRGCQKLIEIQGMNGVSDCWALTMSACDSLSIKFKNSILQEMCKSKDFDIVISGGAMPEWFSHRGEGSSLSLKVPDAVSDGTVEALLVWVVFVGEAYDVSSYDAGISIWNKSNGKGLSTSSPLTDFCSDYNEYSWVSHMTLNGCLGPCAMQSGDELELSVGLGIGKRIKMCGIHMIVKRPDVVESSPDARWKRFLIEALQQAQIRTLSMNPFGKFYPAERHIAIERLLLILF